MARKLIFSINSGRAGSDYLARILGTAKGVSAFHEAAPQMTGVYLSMINARPYGQTYYLRKFKADAINDFIKRNDPAVYADSSHMFIKTFHDVVVREFKSAEVIILRKKLSEVLKSFIELSYFNKNKVSFDWMSSPNAVTAAVPCIDKDNRLDHYDKSIAYLVDMEARALRFKSENPGVKVHEVTLYDLNSERFVERLFDELEILPTQETYKSVGKPVNQKENVKDHFRNRTSIDYCEKRIQNYIAKARALGIEMPETLL